MEIMRTSPRVLKATNKYITSLGRKREELTEEQWNLMLNYIKARRIGIPFLLFFVVFWIGTTFTYWYQGHKYYTKIIPNQTVRISFDDQKEAVTFSPKEIQRYLSNVIHCYVMAFSGFLMAVMFLTYFIIILTIFKKSNRKAHAVLLSRTPQTGVEV